MAFDMTKVKVGDKLIQRNGEIVEYKGLRDPEYKSYPHLLSNGNSVTDCGYYYNTHQPEDRDIIGFGRLAPTDETSMTELKAVELLLSLGYTLKKGSN